MAAQPLLGDVESGQAAAGPAPKKQTKATAIGKTTDFILPDIAKLGRVIEEQVKKHPERLRFQYEWATKENPEKWAAWVHYYSTYLPAVLRLIKIQFLGEMHNLQGGKDKVRGGLSLANAAWRGGAKDIIKMIQVAENVKNMASQHNHVYDLIMAFLPSAQHTVLDGIPGVDNGADGLEIEVNLKLIHLFCLMVLYAVPPMGTHLLRHFKEVNINHAHVFLADPQELLKESAAPNDTYYHLLQGKWGRAETADTPTRGKLTYKDYVYASFKSRFGSMEKATCGPEDWERDPIHPNWLNLDSGLVFAVSVYFLSLKVNDNSNMTEQKILSEFVDTLSSTIGELKNELELLQTMQNKVVAAASTGFLSVLTVGMHWMQKQVS